MPTTTDRCTCPTASAVCDGPQPDCPVHGYADAAMRWLQMHPDQAPGRTMTESEISKAFGTEYVAWARLCLARIGVTVVPDPEPTNSQQMFADLEELTGDGFLLRDRHLEKIAKHLTDLGWTKTPEANDDL